MPGETNLSNLLRSMQPLLHDSAFTYCSLTPERAMALADFAWGTFWEPEGVTLILPKMLAEVHELQQQPDWALITLTVHSSLTAVGFLATISQALASAGISLNVVSAFYHDHLFVPWDDRLEALAILERLADIGLPV